MIPHMDQVPTGTARTKVLALFDAFLRDETIGGLIGMAPMLLGESGDIGAELAAMSSDQLDALIADLIDDLEHLQSDPT